ncbi:MAG: chemotaxis protein CheX [Candidatus Sericytochromatia bacterium]|nr:chemotaxis protein CheX [Candidatus Sericytochromatia bacterium]
MNVEFDFITPFYLGAKDIFEQLFNTKVSVSQISSIETEYTLSDITVDLELKSNNFNGKVYYFMDKEFIESTIKVMIGDLMPMDLDSEMTKSALLELNNMITGRALTKLEDMGLIYNMGVPRITVGKGSKISENMISLSLVDLESPKSKLTIGFLTSNVENEVKPKALTIQKTKILTDNKSLLLQISEITLSSLAEIKNMKGEDEVIIKKGEILLKLAQNSLSAKQLPDYKDNSKIIPELRESISLTLDELRMIKGSTELILKKNMILAELAKVMLDILLEIIC